LAHGRKLTKARIGHAMGMASPPRPDRLVPNDHGLRRAATLCPIVERSHGLSVILTRRSDALRAHPGQISFPGGKIDAADASPLDAALREAHEEIGLPPDHVDILGSLDLYPTGTGFLVSPYVGFIERDFRAIAEPGEVAEVFEVPLDFLMDHNNHSREALVHEGRERHFYVINFERRRIWGATAGMLRLLADRLAALEPGPVTEGAR
jgi:8-oxo-dGTP pyrophosphatase MutT (NUDIX family)